MSGLTVSTGLSYQNGLTPFVGLSRSGGISNGPLQIATYPVLESVSSAVTGNAAASITVTKPSGVVAGDILIAFVSKASSAADDITWPSGFTQFSTAIGGLARRGMVAWKLAGGSEPADYTFTPAATANMTAAIFRISGAHTTAPIDVVNQTDGASSTTQTAPSATTTVDNTLILRLLARVGTNTSDTEPSYTEVLNIVSSGSNAGRGIAGWTNQGAAGATGTAVWTTSVSRQFAAFTVAIKKP